MTYSDYQHKEIATPYPGNRNTFLILGIIAAVFYAVIFALIIIFLGPAKCFFQWFSLIQ